MSGNDDWIEWGGGECPVAPYVIVKVQLRRGDYRNFDTISTPALFLEWGHCGEGGDIIKYRIVREAAQ